MRAEEVIPDFGKMKKLLCPKYPRKGRLHKECPCKFSGSVIDTLRYALLFLTVGLRDGVLNSMLSEVVLASDIFPSYCYASLLLAVKSPL